MKKLELQMNFSKKRTFGLPPDYNELESLGLIKKNTNISEEDKIKEILKIKK